MAETEYENLDTHASVLRHYDAVACIFVIDFGLLFVRREARIG
jgi:hypothetical protein